MAEREAEVTLKELERFWQVIPSVRGPITPKVLFRLLSDANITAGLAEATHLQFVLNEQTSLLKVLEQIPVDGIPLYKASHPSQPLRPDVVTNHPTKPGDILDPNYVDEEGYVATPK